MAEPQMAEGYARRDLGKLLTEHNHAIVVGAPGIGKSARFDKLASDSPLKVYRRAEDVLGNDHQEGVVIDDFYDQFTWYRTADTETREAYKTWIEQQRKSDESLYICTTPYRLQWMLEHHREAFDELLDRLTGGWTVEFVQVDRDDANSYLRDKVDKSASINEFEDKIEWQHQFDESLRACLHEDEQFKNIFGETTEYKTLVPAILTAAASDGSFQRALTERESMLSSLKWMFKDISASEAMNQGSGLIDGARQYAETLDTSGALNAVKSAVGSVTPDSVPDASTSQLGIGAAGAALSGPALAVGCIGYWAWATRKEDEETRDTVREEFGQILGSDVLELSAADREDLEAQLELEPKTLLYLNRAASGVTWQKVEQAMADIDAIEEKLTATAERVDDVEETVSNHQELIESLVQRLETTDGSSGYMSHGEFETELYESPDYIPQRYREINHEESDPFGLSDPEPIEGEDAQTRLLEIINEDQSSVTTVVGESGIGKSRLLSEVGNELQNRDDIEMWYVRNPDEFTEPPFESNTSVIFLDESGSNNYIEQFFQLTSENWRESGENCTVHVVVALRPAYQGDIEAFDTPNVERYDIEIKSLTEDGTVSLLSDTSVPHETARIIHQTTDGNPLLSRLLSMAEESNSKNRPPEEKIKDVIENKFLNEADLLESDAEIIQGLLKSIAILGRYEPEVARTAVIETCDIEELKHSHLLNSLRDTNYLITEKGKNNSNSTIYTHKIDVFAEYLQFMAIGDQEYDWYENLIVKVPPESLPELARGLLELYHTTLQRFEFFPEKQAVKEINQRLERVSRRIVNSESRIADVIRVQAITANVAPNIVPYEDLEARYIKSNPGENTAKELFDFITTLYRHGQKVAKVTKNSKTNLPDNSVKLLSVAQTWLSHLDKLAKSNPGNTKIHTEFASALSNAIVIEGEVGQYDLVQQRLSRLKQIFYSHSENTEIQLQFSNALTNSIAKVGEIKGEDWVQRRLSIIKKISEDNPDNVDIQITFAKALNNAIATEHEPSQFDSVQQRLAQLEELVESYPSNTDIHVTLANALVNVTTAEAIINQFDAVQRRLARLEELVGSQPNNTAVRIALANALSTVCTKQADAGRLEEVQRRLIRLEELVATNPDNIEIHLKFAQAIGESIVAEGEAGRFAMIQEGLTQFEDLVELNPENTNIQYLFGVAICNAIVFEGQEGRFNAVQRRIEKLEELVELNPENSDICLNLSQGLVNAAEYEGAEGRFKDVQRRLNQLERISETHPKNKEINNHYAKALLTAVTNECNAGRDSAVQRRLNRLERLVKNHPQNNKITAPATLAHIIGLRYFSNSDMFGNVRSTIEGLNEIIDSRNKICLGERRQKTERILQKTFGQLLRDNRLYHLEELLETIKIGLSEAVVDSLCWNLKMLANELFEEGEIDKNTYTRIEKSWAD